MDARKAHHFSFLKFYQQITDFEWESDGIIQRYYRVELSKNFKWPIFWGYLAKKRWSCLEPQSTIPLYLQQSASLMYYKSQLISRCSFSRQSYQSQMWLNQNRKKIAKLFHYDSSSKEEPISNIALKQSFSFWKKRQALEEETHSYFSGKSSLTTMKY